MTDWDRYPEWAKSVEKFEVTSKQRSGVGVTIHEVGVPAGRHRYDVHHKITEFVENKIIAFRITSGDKLVRKGSKGSWTISPPKREPNSHILRTMKCHTQSLARPSTNSSVEESRSKLTAG